MTHNSQPHTHHSLSADCSLLTTHCSLHTPQASFKKDKNMALIPAIRKEFDFAAIRDSLNIVATIFDDQTQLTIDRNTRA